MALYCPSGALYANFPHELQGVYNLVMPALSAAPAVPPKAPPPPPRTNSPTPTKKSAKSNPIWHVRPTTHVSALYPELLSMIFSYLDVPEKGRAAQVCHSWKDACYHKSVWRGVEAKLHLKKSSQNNIQVFNSLVKRGIKRIQVS